MKGLSMTSRNSAKLGSRTSFAILISLLLAASATGCRPEKEMLKDANCEGKVLTSQEDARKILELAPDGIDEFESGFNESDTLGYEARCGVRDADGKERPAIVVIAGYVSDPADPSGMTMKELVGTFPVNGQLRHITSPDATHLGGASGEGDAVLRVPCTMTAGLPPDMREGAMTVAVTSEEAPDANSLKQRQNAADLALSFLRYTVQKCDESPKLPSSVRIRE